jgi:hypothetical protein
MSVSLHTAFVSETHLAEGQWLEVQVNTRMLKLQMFRVGIRRPTISWTERIYIYFTMALPAHSGPWPRIQFRNHFSQRVGLLGRAIIPSQGLYLNTGQHKH